MYTSLKCLSGVLPVLHLESFNIQFLEQLFSYFPGTYMTQDEIIKKNPFRL